MKLKLIILFAILFILIIFYFLKLYLIVASVNNQLIWRWNLDSKLETSYGSQTLENMIIFSLLEQEARKGHITITENEINMEAKKEEQGLNQGKNFLNFLAANNESLEQFEFEAKQNVLIEKLFGPEIIVTDKELETYLELHKSSYLNWSKTNMKNSARFEIRIAKIQKILQKLKNSSSIIYFVNYPGQANIISAHIL